MIFAQTETARTVAPQPDFNRALGAHGIKALRRRAVTTLQVNVGELCNQACHHCHVDAGPNRSEIMTWKTAERVDAVLEQSSGVELLDLTGGAPELNPSFAWLLTRARSRSTRVMVRCNLTVIFVSGMEWLPEFYRDNEIELVCSLPCYTAENVDKQRGRGVFDQSIAALERLNQLGYGQSESPLVLNLVYNPVGAFLPPKQTDLERKYRDELRRLFGVEFHHLFTITNMPIKRFADQLQRWEKYDEYMGLLINHFNPSTIDDLMCRTLLSVGWEGTLYDCDFNQMLELPIRGEDDQPLTLWDLDRVDSLDGVPIFTAPHCFGCTAGTGSSCGGSLA